MHRLSTRDFVILLAILVITFLTWLQVIGVLDINVD